MDQKKLPTQAFLSLLALLIVAGIGLYTSIVSTQHLAPSPDGGTDWQTYRNEEYGISFSYPPDWRLNDDSGYNRAACTESDPACVKYFQAELTHKTKNITLSINTRQCTSMLKLFDGFVICYSGSLSNIPNSAYLGVTENGELLQYADMSAVEAIAAIKKTLELGSAGTPSWQTYRNEEYGFEVKYPDKLTLKEERGRIVFSHSVPYVHAGGPICDMGAFDTTYDTLEDFNLSIEIRSGKVTLPYVDGELTVGNMMGKRVYEGIEGCGPNTYYFPIDYDRTLVAKITIPQIFSNARGPSMEKDAILVIPGVMGKKESDVLLRQILSTFEYFNQRKSIHQIQSEEHRFDDWPVIRNDALGIEYRLPTDENVITLLGYPKKFSVTATSSSSDYNICFSSPVSEKVTINGVSFCRILSTDGAAGTMGVEYHYLAQHNGKYFDIGLAGTYAGYYFPDVCYDGSLKTKEVLYQNNCFTYKDAVEIFNQILSTFKFTK